MAALTFVLSLLLSVTHAARYDPSLVQYNLNQNENATDPLEYWGQRTIDEPNHKYFPSPDNWRFPFYTIFLDRFVNGDPTNDNINGTFFEHDTNSNQMRHGGDLQGVIDSLDYFHGLGIKGLYVAGSPFINQPWGYDQYSPLDLSVLDMHFGDLALWRKMIDEMHARGMYVVLDNTFATLGDLVGFDGYLNETAPFTVDEHTISYKSGRTYTDFSIGSGAHNKTCTYPKFWNETGYLVDQDVTDSLTGCYDSEFDQYGDTEAFGVFPDWRRQLSKFASVQDRLREWHEPTRRKIENFYCMAIAQLDFDGYRYDKAQQSTVEAMGFMNEAMRSCARRFGKENFFIAGEITGGNDFGSLYLGRGRQPDQRPENLTQAVTLTNESDSKYFLRDPEFAGLDAGAFHYSMYRSLTRFLGMSGNLEAGYDVPRNWVDMHNTFLLTNDLVNPMTNKFDMRHMYGVTNQDVFRWPAIANGTQRQLLGHFISTIHMPGIPLLLWGEEQAFYILDNTASNYIFGRQAMSSASAWQTHGCYSLDSAQYFNMPLDKARNGCNDDTVSYDHRDPSHPVHNIIRHMHQLREHFPVLNDGYYLQQLSNQTEDVSYLGSTDVTTETGMWSVMRSQFEGVQDLDGTGKATTPLWLLYSNLNDTKTYEFDCKNNDTNLNITSLIAPYPSGTTVKNLFYPFDEHTLEESARTLGLNGSTEPNGCLSSLEMPAYDFKLYVPLAEWVGVSPMITKFSPGHDYRVLSTAGANGTDSVDIALEFSVEMDCDAVTASISFNSTTAQGNTPKLDTNSVKCNALANSTKANLVGEIQSAWSWSATLTGVENGIHRVSVRNATTSNGVPTNSNDHFLFRIGAENNPIVFPRTANYSSTLLSQDGDRLTVNHSAPGADMFRYSTNFGSSFSDWQRYSGGINEIQKQPWSGTSAQSWSGVHVRVEYFTQLGGSSDHIQQGDVGKDQKQRRFPHMFLNGPYNQYGYDAGLNNEMKMTDDNTWSLHWMTEWSLSGALAQINVWGINPDGKPDTTMVLGDIDGDSVLDRLPPSSLSAVVLNITNPPPRPALGWKFVVNDGNLRFAILPSGNMWYQLIIFILLWIVPILTAVVSCYAFMWSFYGVKFNEIGVSEKGGFIPMALKRPFQRLASQEPDEKPRMLARLKKKSQTFLQEQDNIIQEGARRRTVLIATMEYDIEDWEIKVKIGGLGVMAQLMGKNLAHQDLIWVVPCCGGIEYPTDSPADDMTVTIMGKPYEVKVQYHKLRNITYVLLDAPVFRAQTKAEPYPARMDDMTSAIYYSAWNQCIAQAINRFPIDLYHINDYHGTIAPLYLLPRTIPAALSLHNAEFQGLWPMRTRKEREEVCSVFNLPQDVVARYVQFGEVFNLLHAGASYLRENQEGFGAVGVSKKYGKRSFARYPIFWGLKSVGALPNPDPSDTGDWDGKLPNQADIKIDPAFEAARPELKRQAQEWAGLEQNPKADLFVFVGRWSMQKGVDLIADVFPGVLENNKDSQLVCIGPVIDLYGKFAALKLERLMKLYPGRVFSKPEFTALPPYIFSGAEFALIPSRDEPFGLVAVEFGRKGALGVGARVGGLGQMPGWWYTVESTTSQHLTKQFQQAIEEALASKTEVRAMMRARSALQRFPVKEWQNLLEILQSTAIRVHDKVEASERHANTTARFPRSGTTTPGFDTEPNSGFHSPAHGRSGVNTPSGLRTPFGHARSSSALSLTSLGARLRGIAASRSEVEHPATQKTGSGLKRNASLGSARGPGHVRIEDHAEPVSRPVLAPIQDAEGDDTGRTGVVSGYYDNDDDEEYDSDEEHMAMPARTQRGHSSRNSDLTLVAAHRAPPGAPSTPDHHAGLLAPPPMAYEGNPNRLSASPSLLSIDTVVGEKTDFKLQKVDPFFTDSNGEFYNEFEKKLESLNASNSTVVGYAIEEYLIKSEKQWFDKYRNAKLGRLHVYSNAPSVRSSFQFSRPASIAATEEHHSEEEDNQYGGYNPLADEFLLGSDFKAPTGLRKWMSMKIWRFDWPVYTFFMALGQIIAANSYQITLLTGEIGQSPSKLYVIASIYLATSMVWWYMFRRLPLIYALSLPWILYGMAFVLIGTAHYAGTPSARGWIQNVGAGLYAAASSSGALFFSSNFGDEGGAQVKAWVFRACTIQGTQQIYVVALWYWGSIISKRTQDGILVADDPISSTWRITAITLPIALLLFLISGLMFFGLPTYYRQTPGKMPSFYTAIVRRKIVLWFFVTVLIQNFFLSAPYGRNWSFLFSSSHASTWQVLLLVVFFFVGCWAGFLGLFGWLSKSHSWILPLFAIGLGAPRWAQIWWGTSGLGAYLPWAGGFTSSALLSRSVWLWLGTLDAIQGVGLGMILLGTLTRVHVAFTLIAAQVLGSVATIVARACAPNKIGPGPISPDITGGLGAMWQAWFWIGLVCNLAICVGFYKFYRKEQLQKP